MDPTPDDDDAVFIRPPFNDFPDAHKHREGLTYAVMAANPSWFLDPADYQTVNGGNPTAVKYPTQLEPPRGWCPSSKKKDAKEVWAEGEEPRLRCTFCRRTYAGVNAKSMWRRHVFEKHKIAMSNRRADNQERKGRGSNSTSNSLKVLCAVLLTADKEENKEDANKSSAARGAARAELELEATVKGSTSKGKGRSRSEQVLESRHASTYKFADDASDDGEEDMPSREAPHPQLVSGDSSTSLDQDSDFFRVATSSSTPPLTPGLSPSSALSKLNAKPETPYNPLLTPSFRHSPARLPIDQPWRFPSPSHPLSSARELSLSMLVCGEASPVVRGLDVSPVVLLPPSERSKRSIFSSPSFYQTKKDAETPSYGLFGKFKGFLKPSPRRLFSESALPTPLTDRLKSQKPRIPESPLGKGFTPIKPKGLSSLARPDVSRTGFSPLKTPVKSAGLLGPIELGSEDPFAETFKDWIRSPLVAIDKRADSPPDSTPECESPVLRSSQLSQTDQLNDSKPSSSASSSSSSSQSRDNDAAGLGIGLMEGFSLKDRSISGSRVTAIAIDGNSSEAEIDDELMLVRQERKRPMKWLARSYVIADGSPAPVIQPAKKKVRKDREFLMDRLLNGDYEVHDLSQPKKRRKTLGGLD